MEITTIISRCIASTSLSGRALICGENESRAHLGLSCKERLHVAKWRAFPSRLSQAGTHIHGAAGIAHPSLLTQEHKRRASVSGELRNFTRFQWPLLSVFTFAPACALPRPENAVGVKLQQLEGQAGTKSTFQGMARRERALALRGLHAIGCRVRMRKRTPSPNDSISTTRNIKTVTCWSGETAD
jgi:hypothetical protein